ncbi:MAG: Tn3 family transposase [Anaerolineae bacterium]|nr:Tn3 family transposase [Anaerolineae bacterium]
MSSRPASRRLAILSPDEIEALYERPEFNAEERAIYFQLTSPEKIVLSQLGTPSSKIHFILQLGYFKARHRFFIFDIDEVLADGHYIQKIYFPSNTSPSTSITKVTRLKQQQIIIRLTGYRECDDEDRRQLQGKAEQLARIDSQPIYILRELLQYLEHQQRIAPGYSWFQDMIGQVLLGEQARLIHIVQRDLSKTDRDTLLALLTNPDGMYKITQLKQEPRHFGNREIAREIQRGQALKPLYEVAQRVIPQLQISNESIKYYASLVSYYAVFQLHQLNPALVAVYLLCFINHRYHLWHDHLITTLCYRVKRYLEEAKTAAKQKVYEQQITYTKDLQKAGQVLKLMVDPEWYPDDTPLAILREHAFGIIDQQTLERVANRLTHTPVMDETAFQWQHLDRLARSFKLSLRPIIRVLHMEMAQAATPLQTALQFLRTACNRQPPLYQYDPEDFPMGCVAPSLKKYLYTVNANGKRHLQVDRYEFMIYRLVFQAIESGDLYCIHSVQFRPIKDELLSDNRWQQKETLIQRTHLSILRDDIHQHLERLENQLENQVIVVNQRIASKENTALQIKTHASGETWSMPQPSLKTAINHPFFNTLHQIDIHTVLHFVQQRCQFMDAFHPLLSRKRATTLEETALIASVVAWGTNTGLGRMGNISDVSNQQLATVSDNFLRPQTLREANDRISDYIASLPIFPHYLINDLVHSSSDGQKFETALPTFNARYSPKYFGLKKGVVAYTLIANHVPINARVIGAHEHESHYVFDILTNNTTTIQPDVHSTDVHGINHLNFAILHIFGYQFAPRYKDLHHQIQTGLCGFKAPQAYDESFLIKPIRKIRTDFIIQEWDNIQRLMVSLALKTTSQHLLIRKLHAYTRQHRIRRALAEYDHIIRSLYLLSYLDSLQLRHNVQRALNRGESYHQLRQAVAYANFGKLRFRTPYEQQLWQECSRLMTNSIVAYNATLLSNLLLHHQHTDNLQQLQLLRRVSPVAWQHINFYGRYEFNKPPQVVDIPALTQQLAQLDIALLEE